MNLADLQQPHLYEMITDPITGQIKLPKEKMIPELTVLDLFALLGAHKSVYFPEHWFNLAKKFLGIKNDYEVVDVTLHTDSITKLAIFSNIHKIMEREGYTLETEAHFEDDIVKRVIYDKVKIGKKTIRFIKTGVQFWSRGEDEKIVLKIENDYINFFANESLEGEVERLSEKIEEFGNKKSLLRNAVIRMDGKFMSIERKFKWDDVILAPDIIKSVQGNVTKFFDNLKRYKKNKMALKRGIILYGPPGNGKTMLGKVLACQANSTFIWVTSQDILNGSVRDLFDLARKLSPCIIFMEDMDFYLKKRGENYAQQVLGELLAQLDGFEENHGIIVIGTTNDKDSLDYAIKERPSRFDENIHIDFPGLEERKRMLIEKSKGMKCHDIDWDKIAKETNEFSGAFVQEIAQVSAEIALEEKSYDDKDIVQIYQKHVEAAVNKIKDKRENKGNSVGFDFGSETVESTIR